MSNQNKTKQNHFQYQTVYVHYERNILTSLFPQSIMDLLTDTYNCGFCMRRDWQERFPRYRGWMIPTCITARVWRMCRDACRNR